MQLGEHVGHWTRLREHAILERTDEVAKVEGIDAGLSKIMS